MSDAAAAAAYYRNIISYYKQYSRSDVNIILLYLYNTKVVFETRRDKVKCVDTPRLIAVETNVAVCQQVTNSELFKRNGIWFCDFAALL